MPPRKSDAAKPTTGDETTPPSKEVVREGINVEDLNLPKSIVTRLAKGVLPPNTQIQGNAMLAMSKSATVFVNYLAAHRKTIAPQDVFKALEDLEFFDFKPRLEAELAKFSEVQADKRTTYRKKVADSKASSGGGSAGGDASVEGEGEEGNGRDGQPAAKRVRRDEGDEGEEEEEEVEEEEDLDEEEEYDGEGDGEERFEVEERDEEDEGGEGEGEGEGADEALDNGEDSD